MPFNEHDNVVSRKWPRASSRARFVLRQDVEGIRLDFVIVLARVQDIEIGNSVNPPRMTASPSTN